MGAIDLKSWPIISVHRGRDLAGHVYEVKGVITAELAGESFLGRFNTERAAVDAVLAATSSTEEVA